MVSDPTYALQGAVTIPVFFHVVTGSDGAGAVTNAQIHQQIAVLNAAFVASGGTEFVFELSGVSRVQNQACSRVLATTRLEAKPTRTCEALST